MAGSICDDCLSNLSKVAPRQTVNKTCRKMIDSGLVYRYKNYCRVCGGEKIINRLNDGPYIEQVMKPGRKKPNSPTSAEQQVKYSTGAFSTEMLNTALVDFSELIIKKEIEIYNEFSLQHELGYYLRNSHTETQVQFERNVSFFGFDKRKFEKREIDITLYRKGKKLLDAAIELKFPRNGQHPEQMYSFCKDVVFAEELKHAGFAKAYVIIFAEDKLFYEGNQDGIYGFWRGGRSLSGNIHKPTGKTDSTLLINGNYDIEWIDIAGPLKYTLIEAQ
jgi:hypothetical protein